MIASTSLSSPRETTRPTLSCHVPHASPVAFHPTTREVTREGQSSGAVVRPIAAPFRPPGANCSDERLDHARSCAGLGNGQGNQLCLLVGEAGALCFTDLHMRSIYAMRGSTLPRTSLGSRGRRSRPG